MNRRAVSLALLAFALLQGSLALAAPAPAATTEIDTGSLTWGVKESWRNYIGNGAVSEGAAVNPDGTYSFPVSSGSFDDETNTTVLEFDGRLQWQGYFGLIEPGKWGLDTTFTDLRLEIGPAAQVLRGTHIGYLRSDPGGELHVDEDVVLAKLQIGTATTSFAGGASSWDGIAALAGPGFSLYGEGTVVDPLSFSYEGPGGAPDLGEHFEQPGQVVLEPEGRWVTANEPLSQSREGRDVFAGGAAGVVHIVEGYDARVASGVTTLAAHDPITLEPIGTPLVISYQKNQGHYLKFGFDADTDTFFYVTGRDGASFKEQTVRRAQWNPTTESYDSEPIGLLEETAGNVVGSVVWNPVRGELGIVATTLASSGFNHIADLYTFRESAGGWESDRRPIAIPEAGQLEGLTAELPPLFATISPLDGHALAVARDGSYIQAPGSAMATVGGGEQVPIPALRIEPEWEADPAVTPLWETQLPEGPSTYFSWSATSVGADGSVLLNGVGSRAERYVRIDIDEGGAAVVGPIVEAPQGYLPDGNAFADSMAGDPARGWEWATDNRDPDGYTVNTLVDDELVSRFRYPELISPTSGFPAIDVGHDGALYLPVEDEATGRYGYQRLAIAGVMPTFGDQPQPASVSLAAGEESEPVSFASTVSGGEPATTRQWQVSSAGESSFADIEGETDATLTIDAEREMNGNRYRAVYASDAGRIASDEATLTVEYAPSVSSDPKSRTVTEGSEAIFLAAADGNPEPSVVWQRRVTGFWQNIAPDDDNFIVNGPSLTVLDTNTDQSGALFRAKLINSSGTAFSDDAELTVEPAVSIPEDGLDLDEVSLEWAGNGEVQVAPPFGGSNYLSAGVSSGDEASYAAVEGNAAVFQRPAGGAEALASWATRADHVGGGEQIARLYGGAGRIEQDGSASIAWDGEFSVNFYGGLVPFAIADPELEVGAGGDAVLSADLSGCASSQASPDVCEPLPPATGVTVATFSGVELDPSGVLSLDPDYAGVEVSVPVPFAPQVREGAGWGAWPQPFVDFHAATGLAPYWYTSGGAADPHKAPLPIVLDFAGGDPPGGNAAGDRDPGHEPPAAQPPAPASSSPAAQPPAPAAQPSIVPRRRFQRLNRRRVAKLAKLFCPTGARCRVAAPRWVRVRGAGRRLGARVIVPRRLEPGAEAVLKLRLSRRATRKLGRRVGWVRVRVWMRAGDSLVRRTFTVKIRRKKRSQGQSRGKHGGAGKPGAGGGAGGAPGGGGAPQSGPLSAEPPLLARPASAVDVSGVQVAWHPRDSWIRYVSSGVGAGDGILASGGAAGTLSTASPCPDRPSSGDASLPYTIGFAPRASWYDPVSGTAGIYGQGSVSFRWAAHEIDLTASDPEIEIAGAASRAIFRFSGSGGTPYPNRRAALVSLDPSGQPAVSNGGKTFTYSLMRGTLTEDGVSVFAGFYVPPSNDEFGCVSVSFTTP